MSRPQLPRGRGKQQNERCERLPGGQASAAAVRFAWLIGAVLTLATATPAYAVNYGTMKSLPMDAALVGEPATALQLEWDVRLDVATYRLTRENPDGSLEAAVVLSGAAGDYLDSSIVPGLAYEWRMVATLTNGLKAYGFLRGGIDVEMVEDRGRVLLCVAEDAAGSLVPEIGRLLEDLAGDGWRPLQFTVPASFAPADLKAAIVTEHAADPLTSVFLLGNLPVPYSGSIYPDGHTNHRGAWPADVYYADIDGAWTDSWRAVSSASSSRNHNVIGDGKFDQSSLPSDADLMLGRVDLSDMPAFAPKSEIDLLRQYLDKDHAFRSGALAVPRQALVDDHFPTLSEGVAVTARSGLAASLGRVAVANADWPDVAGGASYLIGAGFGSGSYTSANGLGSTASFAANGPKVVFSLLFGSYFGDWDVADSFLRAPLAAEGTGLASGYSGRPQWQSHLIGSGLPLGEVARRSQNARSLNPYYTSYYSRQVHVALHGDPTLRMFPQFPATGLTVARSASSVSLNWVAPAEGGELLGYHIYRSAAVGAAASRVNVTLVTGTAFTDPSPPPAGATYQVRAIYRETTGSGSFLNNAQAAFATLPALPMVTLGPGVASAQEGAAPTTVTLSRRGDSSAALDVAFEFAGSASPTADVTGAVGVVTIPAGSDTVEIPLSAIADGLEEGAEELVITVVADDPSYQVDGRAGGTRLTIFDSAYSLYAETWFGHEAADPVIAGELADADGDGVVNLLEFLAGSSPLKPGLSPLTAQPDVEVGGSDYRRYQFRQTLAAASLTAVVETSTDLVTWLVPAGIQTSTDPGDPELVTVLVPKAGEGRRSFVRLTVQSP